MSEKSTRDDAETFDVVVTRVLGTPVEEAWKAWSDPAYVTRWWGPTGFTSPSAEMDFRVGGASLVCMRAPAEYGGQDMYHTWTYTTIESHERIGFVSNFADKDGTHLDPAALGMPPGVPHDVPHEITFAPGPARLLTLHTPAAGFGPFLRAMAEGHEEPQALARSGFDQSPS